MSQQNKQTKKIISQNKKARHDFFVDDSYEAGIELVGTEVKSIRAGNINLKDSYCSIDGGQLYALNIHVSPYEQGNMQNHEPRRPRRLLMHKREIMHLHGLVGQKGYTLVPLSVYFSGSNIKMEVGLCRGKKLYDKRDTEAKRQADRDIERAMRSRGRDD